MDVNAVHIINHFDFFNNLGFNLMDAIKRQVCITIYMHIHYQFWTGIFSTQAVKIQYTWNLSYNLGDFFQRLFIGAAAQNKVKIFTSDIERVACNNQTHNHTRNRISY